MIELFVLLIVTIALASIIYYTLKLKISPMPTSFAAKKVIWSLLPEKVEGPIYELGSGWGHLAIPLAKKYPHNLIIAYEYSWIPFLISWLIGKVLGRKNLQIIRGDFFKADLSQARLIVVYLYPAAMEKLVFKIPSEATLISNTFALPDRKPTKTLYVKDLYDTPIYLYYPSLP